MWIKYHTPEGIEKSFDLALTRSQVEAGYLNLKATEMELYQNMIRGLVFLELHTQSLPEHDRQKYVGTTRAVEVWHLWRSCPSCW